ncbi:hypothetical protein KDL01_41530, partial [Actinospica durhamensis]
AQPAAPGAAGRPAVFGNAAAAAAGIRPGVVRDGRLYLAVPREEKEDAKAAAQARWSPALELWHVDAARFADPQSPDRHRITRWLP